MNIDALRKSLAEAGMSDEDIERMIKSANGEQQEQHVDNDGINWAEFAQVAEEMAKSFNAADTDDSYVDDDEVYEDLDVAETLERFAKAADAMCERTEAMAKSANAHHQTLQKGWLAIGQIVEKIGKQQEATDAKLDAIVKAMNVPVAPRTVSGTAQAVPAPGEQMQKGTANRDSVLQKAQAELRNVNTPPQRKRELLSAVAAIESMGDPGTVAAQFGIPLH